MLRRVSDLYRIQLMCRLLKKASARFIEREGGVGKIYTCSNSKATHTAVEISYVQIKEYV